MSDFEGKLFLLRYQRTAFWQVFQRINCLNEPAKPLFCGFGFFFDITNEANVVLGIAQCWFRDVNVKRQVSPEVPLEPVAQA